jgi:subtilisin family serine protease
MAAKRKAAGKRPGTGKKRATKKTATKKTAVAKRAVTAAVARPQPGDAGESRRQLVVVPHAALEAATSADARFAFAPAIDVHLAASRFARDLSSVLSRAGATIGPLFSETQLTPQAPSMAFGEVAAAASAPHADLGMYQVVRAQDDRLEDLAAELIDRDLVAGAYVKPRIELPARPSTPRQLPFAATRFGLATPPGATTPDFSASQRYLEPSPDGVDARWAWTQQGGKGDGVSIIDIEGGWCFTHEDLTGAVGGLVGGVAINDVGWRNHGTAVLSEMVGDDNTIGVTGIAPGARVTTVSHQPNGSAAAILLAARRMRAGDIMLLEMHQPGPRFNFQERPQDQRGYIAVEWWPDDFDAVSFAVRRGILVVSAAGNGAQDLDDPLYSIRPNTPPHVFPRTWSNPFNRSQRDSGSILVGAGAPPTGTFGPDRSRLDFSNFGALIDAQGWGRDVTACGYGDLQGGPEERFYTANFAGTSSASPIVVGALAAIQGIRRATGGVPLTPSQARALLRGTGASQVDGPNGPATQRIGNRPDIRAMVASMP